MSARQEASQIPAVVWYSGLPADGDNCPCCPDCVGRLRRQEGDDEVEAPEQRHRQQWLQHVSQREWKALEHDAKDSPSGLTPELSRAAKRRRLGRIVRWQPLQPKLPPFLAERRLSQVRW